jgi:predicted Ser/Thr protein kinase
MTEQLTELGEFRVRGVLGEGGGGVVYEAEGPDGVVALKVPHIDRELTERDRRRYLDEAAMMDRVRHPAIVEVLASGMLPDGRPFVAMPRLLGRTVAERVYDEGPFELDTALRLIEQLADATMAMHQEDLLHRDLKAENVFLIGDDEAVKLLDFGIAKDRKGTTSLTTTGMVRGTPATMAPERFFGSEASEQSDVYELALVFYVMVTGQLPWAHDDPDVVGARTRPVPPHLIRATVPPAVSDVILEALATRPELRPATPRALAAALHRAAAEPAPPAFAATETSEHLRPLVEQQTPFDAAVPSRPEGPKPMSASPAPRRMWGLALAAAVTLVAGAKMVLPAPSAVATATLGATMAAAGVQVMSTVGTVASAAVDERDPGETETREVEAEDAEGDRVEARPSTSADVVPRPTVAAPNPTARRPAPAPKKRPETAEPTPENTPIPGGVYDTSPY